MGGLDWSTTQGRSCGVPAMVGLGSGACGSKLGSPGKACSKVIVWAGGLAYVCEMSMCELAQVVVWGLGGCACKCARVRAEAVPKLGMCAFVLSPSRDSAQLLFPVW